MQVFLDNDPLETDAATLAQALQAAVEAARQRGRVIVEVEADGEPVADEDLDNPSQDPAFCDELRFVSAEPRSLVRVTTLDAADALEQTRSRCAQASEMLQTGQIAEALRDLAECLAAWETARRVVQEGCALLGLPLESEEGLGPGAQEQVAALTETLEAVKAAVASQDWATLADLLAYDLDEQADAWRRAMQAMGERLSA